MIYLDVNLGYAVGMLVAFITTGYWWFLLPMYFSIFFWLREWNNETKLNKLKNA